MNDMYVINKLIDYALAHRGHFIAFGKLDERLVQSHITTHIDSSGRLTLQYPSSELILYINYHEQEVMVYDFRVMHPVISVRPDGVLLQDGVVPIATLLDSKEVAVLKLKGIRLPPEYLIESYTRLHSILPGQPLPVKE